MSYEKKTAMKLLMCIFFVILGAAAFSIGMYIKIRFGTDNFSVGYLEGTGTGLFVVGIIMCIQKLRILKNKEKLRANKIECEDERNLALSFKSSHYSLVVTVILLYISSFYFAFSSEDKLSIITSVICGLVFFKLIFFVIMKRIK